jgi:hypothetical protein
LIPPNNPVVEEVALHTTTTIPKVVLSECIDGETEQFTTHPMLFFAALVATSSSLATPHNGTHHFTNSYR